MLTSSCLASVPSSSPFLRNAATGEPCLSPLLEMEALLMSLEHWKIRPLGSNGTGRRWIEWDRVAVRAAFNEEEMVERIRKVIGRGVLRQSMKSLN